MRVLIAPYTIISLSISRKMSAARSAGIAAGTNSSRKTYIATRAYTNDFFSYATSNVNFNTVGSLGPVAGASDANCAAGQFLRETGHRLYPGANPGVNTLMVGVFDFYSGLKGFIDPNSTAFAVQNSDRTYSIDTAGYSPNTSDPFNRNDQAAPVYTRGNIRAEGNEYIGQNISTMGNMYVQQNISTIGNLAIGSKLYLNASANSPVGTTFLTSGTVTVANTSVTANSKIFISMIGQANPGYVRVSAINPGVSFTLSSTSGTDGSTYNYLIVN